MKRHFSAFAGSAFPLTRPAFAASAFRKSAKLVCDWSIICPGTCAGAGACPIVSCKGLKNAGKLSILLVQLNIPYSAALDVFSLKSRRELKIENEPTKIFPDE
jgi:hypothetical protein